MTRVVAMLALAIFPALSIATAIPTGPSGSSGPSGPELPLLSNGGRWVAPNEVPSQVSIISNRKTICGGVLLNANTVLSTARCALVSPLEQLQVRVGSTSAGSEGGITVDVTNGLLHQNYDASNPQFWGVSLLKLAIPIEESEIIKHAHINGESVVVPEHLKGNVMGYGANAQGTTPSHDTLYVTEVEGVSHRECEAFLGRDPIAARDDDAVDESLFCAKPPAGQNSCQGDEGAPLVDPQSGAVSGLSTWAFGCKVNGLGVYTDLGFYESWINVNSLFSYDENALPLEAIVIEP